VLVTAAGAAMALIRIRGGTIVFDGDVVEVLLATVFAMMMFGMLPAWSAASLLVGYATAFAVLGAWRTMRADIHEST
jgi:hypothetical protein